MLDRFRGTHITWTHANQRLPNIEAHSGDVNGRRLIVQIKDDEIATDVSNCNLYLLWKCGESDNQDRFSFDNGVFVLPYSEDILSCTGSVSVSLLLVCGTMKIESKKFALEVSAC